MGKVTVVYTKPAARGRQVDMPERYASVLEKLGLVRLAEGQQYMTRDMVAGGPSVPVKRGRGRPRKYPKPAE